MAKRFDAELEEKYIKKVEEIFKKHRGDNEAEHSEIDELLDALLLELGFTKLVNYIQDNRSEWWYA